MKALLLIAVLVLVVGGNEPHNPSPCMKNPDNNAYRKFVLKHVLQETFVTSDVNAWKTYLMKYKLCNRPTQSFVDKGAENLYVNICNGSGKHRGRSNMCTSTKKVGLHDLSVNTNDCSITSLRKEAKYVTVACDNVDNQCLPVHFQDSQNKKPDDGGETCKP